MAIATAAAVIAAMGGSPALAASGDVPNIGRPATSIAFYSTAPGSGNHVQWTVTLPKDPPADVVPGRTWNFQLRTAFDLTMAMCDTQSYPEQVSTCVPDSDANITPLARHPGTAALRVQFYPPAWVQWPAGTSCDPTRWCSAVVIDSLSQNPVNGTLMNGTCLAQNGGLEYENFAFVTPAGVPIGPPGPLTATIATFDPQGGAMFMNPGDRVRVTLSDTSHGLRVDLRDLTTQQTGFMQTSASNGFQQIQFDPSGTSCSGLPYDFHPMYSTSSTETRVPWSAQSFNIGYSDELGRWDSCDSATNTGGCSGKEGDPHANSNTLNDSEPTDSDNSGCFSAPAPPAVQVSGCGGINTGFDGVAYHRSWPDGDTNLHPTAVRFTSPHTGSGYHTGYPRVAFENNLPALESNTCDRSTGEGCTLVPTTDDAVAADFFPFFSTGPQTEGCQWALGSFIPGFTESDFGGNAQYGLPLRLDYLQFGGNGATVQVVNAFRQILSHNPCAGSDSD